ncbi:hypothetical protein ADUPG1_000508 [Aduncisulcus paluster]|uniref:Uncharacterized protein n=1 Tax=Aduncisulcus paluster TaxID=2918883 RepID=A0ABQ5K6L3_9EUKA|nr:hypothetical protein ADUPG1_000508 [Aduncisulcus paluster]
MIEVHGEDLKRIPRSLKSTGVMVDHFIFGMQGVPKEAFEMKVKELQAKYPSRKIRIPEELEKMAESQDGIVKSQKVEAPKPRRTFTSSVDAGSLNIQGGKRRIPDRDRESFYQHKRHSRDNPRHFDRDHHHHHDSYRGGNRRDTSHHQPHSRQQYSSDRHDRRQDFRRFSK